MPGVNRFTPLVNQVAFRILLAAFWTKTTKKWLQKKFALNSPLSESDRGGLERKLFGGVCGKKASLKIAWDAFRAVDATFRLFLGVCVATETSEDR